MSSRSLWNSEFKSFSSRSASPTFRTNFSSFRDFFSTSSSIVAYLRGASTLEDTAQDTSAAPARSLRRWTVLVPSVSKYVGSPLGRALLLLDV